HQELHRRRAGHADQRGCCREVRYRAVIPGWSEGPDLRCAIAHRGISRFPVRLGACHRARVRATRWSRPGMTLAYIIPDSSSSAFSISSSLTTTSRRGTRKNMAAAQAIDSAKIADVSGSVVVEW